MLVRPDTDRRPPAVPSARPGTASRHGKHAAAESRQPAREQRAESGHPIRNQATAEADQGARRQTAAESGLWHRLIRIAACVVVGSTLVAIACPVTAHWLARAPNLGWVAQADELGLQLAAPLGAAQQPEIVSSAVASGYLNPLRGIPNLVLERIDQGVDFAGSGPVYALGDAVITNATSDSGGWPGGGWITYQLSDGPDAGLIVYVAEDITPSVQIGEHVTSSTVVGNMFDGSDGIETGWAQPTGVTAESQAAAAGGIGAFGPFPTKIGYNFDELLQSVGVPPAPNAGDPASGLLPPNYPANGG